MRKTSLRWPAPVCFLIGLGLLVQSTFQPSEMTVEVRLGPALVALGFAVIFWGLLTVQNILQLLAAIRGQPVPGQGGSR